MSSPQDDGLTRMSTGQIDDRFSNPGAAAPSWASVEALLEGAELYWLTTVRADGRPHVTPLVGVWSDGSFAFCTGVGEQKHVNLQHSPLVTVTTGSNAWKSGTDVVVEGTAQRVTGRERLGPLAERGCASTATTGRGAPTTRASRTATARARGCTSYRRRR